MDIRNKKKRRWAVPKLLQPTFPLVGSKCRTYQSVIDNYALYLSTFMRHNFLLGSIAMLDQLISWLAFQPNMGIML